jgi:hypothetical protein
MSTEQLHRKGTCSQTLNLIFVAIVFLTTLSCENQQPLIQAEHLASSPSVEISSIHVTNAKNRDISRYPIALLSGVVDNNIQQGAAAQDSKQPLASSLLDEPIQVTNLNNLRPEGTTKALIQRQQFKILVELVPGVNRLHLSAGAAQTDLELTYKPMTTSYRVNIIYVTPSDGNTRYYRENPYAPQDYKDKLDTAAKLLQTFTAECMNDQGLGRKTFNLEFDKDGKVVIHTLRFPASEKEFKNKSKNGGIALYNMLYDWVTQQFPDNHTKNLVMTSVGGADILLGKSRMALLDSTSFYAWPNDLESVQRAATDAMPAWGLGAVGSGLHELGHCFGCDHSADPASIMSIALASGMPVSWFCFNRAFTVAEPGWRKKQQELYFYPKSEIPRWEPYYTAQFYYHRWFQPDAREFHTTPLPTIEIDQPADEIVIRSPYGIGAVQFFGPSIEKTGNSPPPKKRGFELFKTIPPTVLRYKRGILRAMVSAPLGADIIVTDTEGNVIHTNEGGRRSDSSADSSYL